jgi:ABC-2 type transport system ATP-binding protein
VARCSTQAVRCRGLKKTYPKKGLAAVDDDGDVIAVDGVDLDVLAGECFGLLGHNGAGKTTTVEVLEGLLAPTDGEVEVLGKKWETDESFLRERIGLSLQQTFLPDKLNVEETVRLFRSFFSEGRTVKETIALVALEEKARARYETLSGGQRQRLAVACALVSDPELLFLDEPTTGLDPQSRRMLWDVISKFRNEGGSVVLTTHYMDEAERLCDRVGVIDHGKMIALGTPKDLIATLGGSHIIEVQAEGPRLAELTTAELATLAGIYACRELAGRMAFTAGELHVALPAILTAYADKGLHVTNLSTHSATLEDVFVHLTGRQLRD